MDPPFLCFCLFFLSNALVTTEHFPRPLLGTAPSFPLYSPPAFSPSFPSFSNFNLHSWVLTFLSLLSISRTFSTLLGCENLCLTQLSAQFSTRRWIWDQCAGLTIPHPPCGNWPLSRERNFFFPLSISLSIYVFSFKRLYLKSVFSGTKDKNSKVCCLPYLHSGQTQVFSSY